MSAAITAAVGGAVVGSMLANDNGAEGANSAAADNSRQQAQIAKEQWARYKELYEPLERQMVQEAQNYDTPAAYATAAGEASASVSEQFGKARDRLSRTPGLDPTSAAYTSSMAGLDLAQAASDATQQNLARKQVKDTAYTRKQAALAMGKGLDSTAASGLATSASQNLAMAGAAQAQSNQEAGALGRVTSNVISALPKSGWLGSADSGSYYAGGAGNGSNVYTNAKTGATFDWGAVDF